MRRYLTTLAWSGLLSIGALSGAPAFAGSIASASIPDIAPTVDAAGQAFRTIPPGVVDGGVFNLSCGTAARCDQGSLQPGVLIHRHNDPLPADPGGVQLVHGGGGGGGGHGGGGGGFGGGGHGGGGFGGGFGGHGFGGGFGGHGGGGFGGFHGMGRFGNEGFFRRGFGNGGGGDGWYGFGLGYPYYDDYYSSDYYGIYNPGYYTSPGYGVANTHIAWCAAHYRSYRPSDNTFQPYNGPRQECISP